MIKIIKVHFGVAQEKKTVIAHFCKWPGVKFGKADVCKVPRVTAVVSNGPVLRLSDETQANRSEKKT